MNLVCTSCPVGCRLTIIEDDGKLEVSGNACKRGETYAADEATDPKRMVTSSVKIEQGVLPLVSVKTNVPIQKAFVSETINLIKKATVIAPIAIGDVIIPNVAGTGVNIVATRKVDRG